MRPRGLHLDDEKDWGIGRAATALKLSPSTPPLKGQIDQNLPIESAIPAASNFGLGDGASWGESWRWNDPFHFLGMVPVVGIPYRLAVVGGSMVLDLATWERQGIENPLSLKGSPQPNWLHIQTAW